MAEPSAQIGWYIDALRHEGALLVEAVARVDLDATVPTCPEWTVRELGRHVGRVHRWAAAHVRDRRAEPILAADEPLVWGVMPDDAALADWLADGIEALAGALARAEPRLACWTFLPAPSPLAFWARRQAHETAIHRVDAQVPRVQPGFSTEFAVDGIDELLLGFFGRPRNRVRSDHPRTVAVAATDADASWIIHIGPEGARPERGNGPADTTVRAPASELYLALWNRAGVKAVQCSGDPSGLALWRTLATVRWS